MANTLCLVQYFFDFVLLDYFLKYSGDTNSKEQLSLAKAGSFSHSAVFHGSSSKLYTKPKQTARNKSIQERLTAADFTSPCAGSQALGCERVGSAPRQGDSSAETPGVTSNPCKGFASWQLPLNHLHAVRRDSEHDLTFSINQGLQTFGLDHSPATWMGSQFFCVLSSVVSCVPLPLEGSA